MPYAELRSGATLYYLDEGAGQPLALVHGMLGLRETDRFAAVDLRRDDHDDQIGVVDGHLQFMAEDRVGMQF